MDSKLTDYVFVTLLLIYIFLFEWTLFDFELIKGIVNSFKVGIPVVLFLIVLFSGVRFYKFLAFQNYMFIMLILFAWALIPSLLSDQVAQSAGQWSKFLFRCLALFAVGIYFMARPQAQLLIIKALSVIAVVFVVQYACLNIAFITDPWIKPSAISGNGAPLYGPLGILAGPVTASISGAFRLVGYWREPSNAAGFLFPAFFLSQAIYIYSQKVKWKFLSYICLTGGICCLSNAGYLAIGGAVLFGILRQIQFPKIKISHFIGLILAALVILFGVFGRYYVSTHDLDSDFMKGVTGADSRQTNVNFADIDGGRAELLQSNLGTLLAHPIGIGIRIPGGNKAGDAFEVTAGAIGYWLTFIGIPGVVLLLLLQFQILRISLTYPISMFQLNLTQAWIAISLQQSVYGNWMSPLFLTLAVLVLTSIFSLSDGEEVIA